MRSSNFRVDRAYLWTSEKTGTFSRISPHILDQFSQSFHHMKALYIQMMDLHLVFLFFKGCCHGNQIILRKCHQCRLIPRAFVAPVLENELQYYHLAVRINSEYDGAKSSKIWWNFARWRLICERQVRHGQKTGVFCQYLRIYWKHFPNIFIIWKRFTCRWWICTLFSNLSWDDAMANK